MQAAISTLGMRPSIIRCLDGAQEHVHSGQLTGEKASVSLISSSRDEKAAGANYSQYGIGLLLLVQTPREPKQ